MKKTSFSLAIFGAIAALSCSAFAQSAPEAAKVSVYGLIETSASIVNGGMTEMSNTATPGTAIPGSTSINGLQSRIGFRGNEDLGQGYRAKFEFEQRFTPNTGAAAVTGLHFAGRSVLGADTPYGEILLGRNYSPAYYTATEADPFAFDNSVGGLGATHTFAGYAANAYGSSIRMDNSVTFTSKEMHGFTSSVAIASNENLGAAKNTEFGFNSGYKRDALKLGYAYDHRGDGSSLSIGVVSYDLGFVKPIASYSRAVSSTASMGLVTTDYSFGAIAPLGNGVLKAVVANISPADGVNTTKFGLGYEYKFSARTSLFTDVGTAKKDNFSSTTGFDIGMRHRF